MLRMSMRPSRHVAGDLQRNWCTRAGKWGNPNFVDSNVPRALLYDFFRQDRVRVIHVLSIRNGQLLFVDSPDI